MNSIHQSTLPPMKWVISGFSFFNSEVSRCKQFSSLGFEFQFQNQNQGLSLPIMPLNPLPSSPLPLICKSGKYCFLCLLFYSLFSFYVLRFWTWEPNIFIHGILVKKPLSSGCTVKSISSKPWNTTTSLNSTHLGWILPTGTWTSSLRCSLMVPLDSKFFPNPKSLSSCWVSPHLTCWPWFYITIYLWH